MGGMSDQPHPSDGPHLHRWHILIVDDHPIVRMGLAALIDAEPDMRVVAHAEDVRGAIEAMERQPLDLIVIDLSLRESSGLDLLKEVVRRGLRAMVVSMQDAPTWAERALAAGARGYVHKSEAGRNIVQAIRKVRSGRLYVSDPVSQVLLERRLSNGRGDDEGDVPQVERLTDRELEVLSRIGKGLTTTQISAELQVSPKTVQTYRDRIKRKLALDNAAELSAEAARWVAQRG